MNRRIIVLGIEIALVILTVFTASAMAGPNTVFFTNYSGDTSPGGTSYVELWVNVTDPHGDIPDLEGNFYAFGALDINVTFDSSIGDITACNPIPGHPWDGSWMKSHWGDSWVTTVSYDCWVHMASGPPYGLGPGVYPIANYTIEGNNPGIMDLAFDHELPRYCAMTDCTGEPYPNQTWEDGTFTCTGSAEIFTKKLVLGWNLISLPLVPTNNDTSAVLSTMSGNYSAVYRYNAETKEFEDVTTGTMDPGIGYFVNVTTTCTWSYEGTPPYTSMSIDLKQGLNMIGWLNCSKQISGNLTSIAGKYNYNARWNAGYEVYEPHAPEIFNDFEMMDRGNGYWIAAKEDCTLTVSCSG